MQLTLRHCVLLNSYELHCHTPFTLTYSWSLLGKLRVESAAAGRGFLLTFLLVNKRAIPKIIAANNSKLMTLFDDTSRV